MDLLREKNSPLINSKRQTVAIWLCFTEINATFYDHYLHCSHTMWQGLCNDTMSVCLSHSVTAYRCCGRTYRSIPTWHSVEAMSHQLHHSSVSATPSAAPQQCQCYASCTTAVSVPRRQLISKLNTDFCSSAATSRRHCFSHRTLHHSVQLCHRL